MVSLHSRQAPSVSSGTQAQHLGTSQLWAKEPLPAGAALPLQGQQSQPRSRITTKNQGQRPEPSRAERELRSKGSLEKLCFREAVVKTRTEAVDHEKAHNLTDVIKNMGFAELNQVDNAAWSSHSFGRFLPLPQQVGEKNAPKRASSLTIVA